MLAPNGNAARYILVLDGDPDGATAIDTLSQARSRPAGDARSQRPRRREDRRHRRHHDRLRTDRRDTGPPSSACRRRHSSCCSSCSGCCCGAGSAPLYLVGSSLLVVAAALGLTVYVFQDLLGYGELAFFVPVASAILLLALGADYNVFLISRIWREADQRGAAARDPHRRLRAGARDHRRRLDPRPLLRRCRPDPDPGLSRARLRALASASCSTPCWPAPCWSPPWSPTFGRGRKHGSPV